METYRTPEAYIADIEVMIGKSNRTAQRVMKQIRAYYGLARYKRPTIDQVRAYLVRLE